MGKRKKAEIISQQTELANAAREQGQRAISQWLRKVRFSKRLWGADEADVWKKIEKLCELYETALAAERDRVEELEQRLQAQEEKPDG